MTDNQTTNTSLRGPWLPSWPRVAWVAVAVLAVGLSVATGPAGYRQLTTVCTEVDCPSDQLTPEKLQDLQDLGPSIGLFAGVVTGFKAYAAMVWVLMGAIIFWRKSHDRMALFASITLVASGNLAGSWVGPEASVVLRVANEAITAIGLVLLITLLFVFPDGRFVPRWTRLYIILWVASTVALFGILDRLVELDSDDLGPYYIAT